MPRYRGVRWYVPLAIMLAVSAVLIAVSWLLPSLGGGHPIYARDGEIGNFFNVDEEGNLPTWWSTIQLGGGAILYLWGAWLSRASRTRGTVAWVLVALVLFAMSLDEATQLHEQLAQLSGVIASPFGNEYAWLAVGIPVAIGVVVVALVSGLRMPRRSLAVLLIGFVVFFGGAVGTEALESDDPAAQTEVQRAPVYRLEGGLGMAGASLIAVAPLAGMQVAQGGGAVALRLRPRRMRPGRRVAEQGR